MGDFKPLLPQSAASAYKAACAEALNNLCCSFINLVVFDAKGKNI
jgi:hypothetical protein